jgi:ABC-type multidrug transport system permease subunit
MMPVFIVANDWMYHTFLEGDYLEAAASLEQAQRSIGEINDEVMAERISEPSTLLERAKAAYDSALANVDIDRRLKEYRLAAESISENTIKLVVVFLMQTLVFPLLFMFILLGVIRRLTRH